MSETPTTAEAGAFAFARFAYPPNSLGYCGPSDSVGFLEAAVGGRDLAQVEAHSARFDGAWPYLQLIASYNSIDSPLDRRVVDAYWIGNDLLHKVPARALVSHLDGRFERRSPSDFGAIALAALNGGSAHHSFHVFAVYPWLGLLRAGMDGSPLVVLDRCRVRPATVLSVQGDVVVVRNRPLVLRGRLLVEGDERIEEVRRSLGGVGFECELSAGDIVALHWDWVCGRLSPGSLARLRHWTRQSLHAVNALDAPGPAVACDARGT